MKAEKEMGIPIEYRTGFAISREDRERANEMDARQWETFYRRLCGDPQAAISRKCTSGCFMR